MTYSAQPYGLNKWQRILLLSVGLLLAMMLFFLRAGGLNSQSPLDQLARRSLDPDTALANGRPTIFEFYADWCEACREMAPAMLQIEEKYNNQIDIVLLNVDNIRWQDFVDSYQVNGIPQLNFFDANGGPKGKSLGVRSEKQINELVNALMENKTLPSFPGVVSLTGLIPKDSFLGQNLEVDKSITPMSHS